MSVFAARARQLQDRLLSLTLPVPQIHALMLVDRDGLTLVSTLRARTFEEGLAAFCAAVSGHLERARRDFDMGSMNYFLLAGRKRQVFMAPVGNDVTLVAVADPAADPALVTIHLLAVAREILELLLEPNQAVVGTNEKEPRDPA